jgi:hypothetical protein
MEDLKILVKMEELDAYSHKALVQFPKYEKFVLCADIRKASAEIIRLTVRTAKRYHKKTTLQDLDIEVEFFRSLIRKAHRMGYINVRKRGVWMGHVNEIGKMVGGWIKSVK